MLDVFMGVGSTAVATMETESNFEAIVRKAGNSFVITIPREVLTKLDLADNSGLSVHIRKWSK